MEKNIPYQFIDQFRHGKLGMYEAGYWRELRDVISSWTGDDSKDDLHMKTVVLRSEVLTLLRLR